MTKLEWYNQQTKEVQVAFKKYCNTLNHKLSFETWVTSIHSGGLSGAFQFAKTEEGYDYWRDLSQKFKDTQRYKDLQS